MTRITLGSFGRLVVGLVCVVGFTMATAGCASNKCSTANCAGKCDKPCAKTAGDKGGCGKKCAGKCKTPCSKTGKDGGCAPGCTKPCCKKADAAKAGSKATTAADKKGGCNKPCGSKATTAAGKKGGCNKPCGSKATTAADKKTPCKPGCKKPCGTKAAAKTTK